MTTATGQYTLDFTGMGDENPWVETGWTQRTAYGGKIVSGALFPETSTGTYHTLQYTGGSYSGATVVVRAEMGAVAADNDFIDLVVANASGVGYVLYVRADQAQIYTSGDWTNTGSSVANGSWSLSAGDVVEFSVTVASPNTFTVSKNGSAITLDAYSHSQSITGTAQAAIGFWPLGTANQSIKSIGLDIAPDDPAPAEEYPPAATRRYQHLLTR